MAEHAARQPDRRASTGRAGLTQHVAAARLEPSPAWAGAERARVEAALGFDLTQVQVHEGPAAATAAESVGARALTIGHDVYLGSAARRLQGRARDRLLAHEAVHTVQQGVPAGTAAAGALPMSLAGDAGEREADALADAAFSGSSGSLGLRRRLRRELPGITRRGRPMIQRDLAASHPVAEGVFEVDLKTESHPGAKSGMSGTISFMPGAKAPDSKLIKLLQVARLIDGTGKDYVWTGAEANRNKAMTAPDLTKGVTGGFFVDHSAAAANPRTAKADPDVSPYYRSYWPNATRSQDGSKAGKAATAASLWDFPGWGAKSSFRFETAAKDVPGGHVYGTMSWGFDLTDPVKGKVENEFARRRNTQSGTFDAAVTAFDEFYRNPGSSNAPTK